MPRASRPSTVLAVALLAAIASPGLRGQGSAPPRAPAPGGGARPAAAPAAAPATAEPTLIDFGVVEPGSAHEGTFAIRNGGSAPLRIAAVIPSCKCTTAEGHLGKEIAPGGTYAFTATMEAPHTPGVKDAKVNILFAGFQRPLLLELKCEVLLPIKAVEEFVDALEGKSQGLLTIESRDGAPFTILSSNGAAPQFVGFDPAVDSPRNRYQVRWSVDGWPCEGMRLWWIIETDRADCPILPCRIRHECSGVRADPTYRERKWLVKEPLVDAGRIKPGQPVRLRLLVENGEPKAGPQRPAQFSTSYREISAVQSLAPDATAKLLSVEPRGADQAVVTFEFTPRADANGLLYTMVRLHSPTGAADLAVVASIER